MFEIIVVIILVPLALAAAWYGFLLFGYAMSELDHKAEKTKARYTERQLVWFGRAVKTGVVLALCLWSLYMWVHAG